MSSEIKKAMWGAWSEVDRLYESLRNAPTQELTDIEIARECRRIISEALVKAGDVLEEQDDD